MAIRISLSPDVERLIAEKISSGRYHSADELVLEALKLIQERETETQSSPSNRSLNLATAFENIAKDVPDSEWASVPSDLSANIDHYLYGVRKTS
jgi:antitoxin ParD1/3/4